MIPSSYITEKQKIDEEIKRLKEQAEELQERHRGPAMEAILTAMREYNITPDEINAAFGGTKRGARSGTRTPLPPKYRDPATGKTWSGRGRTPLWITEAEAQGGNRTDFKIV